MKNNNSIPVQTFLSHRKWTFISLIGLSCVFLFIANVYSWLMTAYGLILSGFLPPDTLNGIISGETMAYTITMVLQLVIFIFYILLPFVFNAPIDRRMRVIFITVITIMLLMFITASAAFSLVSITYRAKANDYSEHTNNQIFGINDNITSLDFSIKKLFKQYVDDLGKLIDDSQNGLDESGLPGRGKIYRSLILKRKEVIEKYGNLQTEISFLADNTLRTGKEDSTSNVNILWQKTATRLSEIHQKHRIFESFTANYEIQHYADSTSETMYKIEENYLWLNNTLFNRGTAINDIFLVFNKTFQNIREIFTLSPNIDKTVYIAFFIALWPDLLSVSLVIILTIANSAISVNGPPDNREKELLNEKKRLEKIIPLEQEVGNKRMMWQYLKKIYSRFL